MMNTVSKIADNLVGKKRASAGTPRADGDPTLTMRAVTWRGKQNVSVETVPRPIITHPGDVIVRVTACAICSGSDLHIYNGEIPTTDVGLIIGHEGMGIIEQKGDEVQKFSVGDRVVIAFDIACGHCDMCHRQEFTGCRETNDSRLMEKAIGHAPGALFGYSRLLGNVSGSQAECVRVPFADTNCYKIPDAVPDEKALYITDVLSTSLHAVEMGHVKEGDTVCIWGLGPIGLNAVRWAQLKGAARVIGVDYVPERLALAQKTFGIETVDRLGMTSADVVQRLNEMLPGGADVVIEAVGFRFAMSLMHKMERALGMETDSPEILEECFKVCRPYGSVSIIGDYVGYANQFPVGLLTTKHLKVESGQCPVQKYFGYILEKLQDGSVDPTFMITHRICLEETPLAYRMLNDKCDGWIKVFIRP